MIIMVIMIIMIIIIIFMMMMIIIITMIMIIIIIIIIIIIMIIMIIMIIIIIMIIFIIIIINTLNVNSAGWDFLFLNTFSVLLLIFPGECKDARGGILYSPIPLLIFPSQVNVKFNGGVIIYVLAPEGVRALQSLRLPLLRPPTRPRHPTTGFEASSSPFGRSNDRNDFVTPSASRTVRFEPACQDSLERQVSTRILQLKAPVIRLNHHF